MRRYFLQTPAFQKPRLRIDRRWLSVLGLCWLCPSGVLLAQGPAVGTVTSADFPASQAIGPGAREVDQPHELKARVIAQPREIPAIADVVHASAIEPSPLAPPSPTDHAAVASAPTNSVTGLETGVEKNPAPSPAMTSSQPTTPRLLPPDHAVADTVREPLKVLSGRSGYAFEQADILLRQRLFGLAHGVTLLAARCVALPEQAQSVQAAFMAWHDKQANAVVQVMHDLAAYYFGEQAPLATWSDVAAALKLKMVIDQALNELEWTAACASLPQAMAGPRYDLTALLGMQPDIAMRMISGELVQPAESSAPAMDAASVSAEPPKAAAEGDAENLPASHKPTASDAQNSETDNPGENNSDYAPHQSTAP